ncbi:MULTISPECIES: hypothetical protein [Pseudomonas]|uniref:Uncharacterized protein n=1 Tax=Pseudomonas mosselii TaxID=78327 RepID=A0A5R8ZI09_9PSED|nr:hypothetical protein [Pseudomonas mosselii]TLP65408.1 hypothetical protein FEM01_04315 [Pseudomonas mosselii]
MNQNGAHVAGKPATWALPGSRFNHSNAHNDSSRQNNVLPSQIAIRHGFLGYSIFNFALRKLNGANLKATQTPFKLSFEYLLHAPETK